MAYTQIYPMHPPPTEDYQVFIGAVIVGLACYGLYRLLNHAFDRCWPKLEKPASVPAPQRRSGVDDNQVVVEVIARASENTYSKHNYVSVSISGRWFTGMTLREAPYRHAELCRALVDEGLQAVQFCGPPPGTHVNGEPFVWAVCLCLENVSEMKLSGARAIFRAVSTATFDKLELVENRIYKETLV